MQDSTIRAIKALIEEAKNLSKIPGKIKKKYPDNIQKALNAELDSELFKLAVMLDHPASFESKLRSRCTSRSHKNNKYFSLRFLPDSPANQLYWNLVALLFKPLNMREMLGIMMPDMQQQMVMHQDDKKSPPHFFRAPLGLEDVPPSIDELIHFVMTDDTIVDQRMFKNLSSRLRKQAQKDITEKFHDVHHGMTQVEDMRQLFLISAFAIVPYKAATPRAAIYRFGTKYQNGGNASRGGYAENATYEATSEFLTFMDSLPEGMRSELLQIRNQTQSLNDIWNNDIDLGRCAITTGKKILELLHYNRAPHEILDVNLLEKEVNLFAPVHVNVGELPEKLASVLIPNLTKLKKYQVIETLAELPAALYYSLISRNLKYDDFQFVLEHVGNGYFNRDQAHAFFVSIARLIPRLRKSGSFWDQVIRHNDSVLTKALMECCDEEDLIAASQLCKSDEQLTLLLNNISEARRYQIIQRPEFADRWYLTFSYIKDHDALIRSMLQDKSHDAVKNDIVKILNKSSSQNQEQAIRFADAAVKILCGTNPVHPTDGWIMWIENLVIMQAALKNFSNRKKVKEFFVKPDEHGNTIFHVSKNAAVVTHFLNMIGDNEKETLLTTPNAARYIPLRGSVLSRELLESMVSCIRQERRYQVFTAIPDGLSTNLLQQHAKSLIHIGVLMRALPASARLKAVYSTNRNQKSPTYLAAEAGDEKLHALLSELTLHERLTALIGDGDMSGYNCSLSILSKFDRRLGVAVSLLSHSEAEELLMHPVNNKNETLFAVSLNSRSSSNLSEVKFWLDILSVNSLLTLFCTPQTNNSGLLSRLADLHPSMIERLLSRLPEARRAEVVNPLLRLIIMKRDHLSIPNIVKLFAKKERIEIIQQLLQLSINFPDLQKPLLNLLDEDDRLPAILGKTPKNETFAGRYDWAVNGTSVLQSSMAYGTILQTTLEMLPQDKRLDFLQTKLEYGLSVMQARLGNNKDRHLNEIPKWLATLTEEQGFALLCTKLGAETLLQKYSKAAEGQNRSDFFSSLSFSEWSNLLRTRASSNTHSFLLDMMIVAAFLHQEDQKLQKKQGCCSLFYWNSAGKLLHELSKCKSVDEVKMTLMTEFEKPQSVYYSKMVATLSGSKHHLSSNLAQLQERWGMKEIKERNKVVEAKYA